MWPADEGCDVSTPDSIQLWMYVTVLQLNSSVTVVFVSAVSSVRPSVTISTAAECRVASVVETLGLLQ